MQSIYLAGYVALCDNVVQPDQQSNTDDEIQDDNETEVPCTNEPRRRILPGVIRTVRCNPTSDPEKSVWESLML